MATLYTRVVTEGPLSKFSIRKVQQISPWNLSEIISEKVPVSTILLVQDTKPHSQSFLRPSRHLDHRPRVHPSRPDEVVNQAKDDNRPRHQDGIIHVFRRDRSFRRPKAKEDHDGQITTCKCIVHDAPISRYMPRAPSQFDVVRRHVSSDGRVGRKYRSGGTSVE